MSTEPKQPQPGEWWKVKKTWRGHCNVRFFVVGKTCDGLMLGMRKAFPSEKNRDPSEYTYGVINGIEQLEHLPDCTGWDWEPPAEPKICTNEELSKIVAELNQAVYHLKNEVFDLKQKVR